MQWVGMLNLKLVRPSTDQKLKDVSHHSCDQKRFWTSYGCYCFEETISLQSDLFDITQSLIVLP